MEYRSSSFVAQRYSRNCSEAQSGCTIGASGKLLTIEPLKGKLAGRILTGTPPNSPQLSAQRQFNPLIRSEKWLGRATVEMDGRGRSIQGWLTTETLKATQWFPCLPSAQWTLGLKN